jgi:hypothetical protein
LESAHENDRSSGIFVSVALFHRETSVAWRKHENIRVGYNFLRENIFCEGGIREEAEFPVPEEPEDDLKLGGGLRSTRLSAVFGSI